MSTILDYYGYELYVQVGSRNVFSFDSNNEYAKTYTKITRLEFKLEMNTMDQVCILIHFAGSNFKRLTPHVTSSKLYLMRLESNPR